MISRIVLLFPRSAGEVPNFDVETVEQAAGSMVDGCDGELIADLRVDRALFGLCEIGLRLEDELNLPGAEFVFALLRLKVFLGEIVGDFRGLHGDLGLLELVDGVRNVEGNRLANLTLGIEIVALGNESVAKIGPRGAILYGKGKCEARAVDRKAEAEDLIQGVAETAGGDDDRRRYYEGYVARFEQ